jgi:hypothetical protein
MSLLLDIFGSTFIAGIIFMMLFNLNVFQTNQRISSDSELQLQQSAKTLAEIVNYDLRKIGYNYPDIPFIQTDSEYVSFYSDIDRDDVMDSVIYMMGDTTEVSGTTNPRDRVLYRIVNADTIKGPSLGLTKAKFSYLDEFGITTTVPADIRYVKAELWVESVEPVEGSYLFTYWEMTINPRNL